MCFILRMAQVKLFSIILSCILFNRKLQPLKLLLNNFFTILDSEIIYSTIDLCSCKKKKKRISLYHNVCPICYIGTFVFVLYLAALYTLGKDSVTPDKEKLIFLFFYITNTICSHYCCCYRLKHFSTALY